MSSSSSSISGSDGTNGRFHIVYFNTFKFISSGRGGKRKHVDFHPSTNIECIVFVGQLAAVVAFGALHNGDDRIYVVPCSLTTPGVR